MNAQLLELTEALEPAFASFTTVYTCATCDVTYREHRLARACHGDDFSEDLECDLCDKVFIDGDGAYGHDCDCPEWLKDIGGVR